VGFVLTYKVSGVFNLAFGAQAFVSAAVYYELRVNREWPIPPAVGVAVFVVAPLLGLILYWGLFRYLRTAPPIARLTTSIGLLIALPEIAKLALDFGGAALFGVQGIVADGRTIYRFGDYAVTRDQLATIVVTIAAVVGLTLLFRYTAVGLRMRAVVESPRMTELAGVSSDRVSSLGWVLSSLFAGLAGVLFGPLFSQLSSQGYFVLIVVAIAAAAFAGLQSLPLALAGGLALGVLSQILARLLPTGSILSQGLRPSLPFVALFLVLILMPSFRRMRELKDPLAGVEPPPPALAADERGPALTRVTHAFAVLVAAGALWFFGFVADRYWLGIATYAVIYSLIFLSITVFTGMAGQISLCQATFAAIGAFTTGQLATRFDMPVIVAMVVGAAFAAATGAVLALPALRLGGIYLALATLAFALFFEEVMVKFDWVSGGVLPVEVPRPQIGPIDFANSRAFLFLCTAMLVIVSFVVIRIRSGTTGRNMRALSGSEVAAASIGVNPARARITAFALSAGIAGLGGGLLGMREGQANYQANFGVTLSLFWVVIVMTLGSRTVEGAIQAGFAFKFFPELLKGLGLAAAWQFIFFGLGAITFARHPEGIIEFNKRMSLNAIQRRIDRLAAWRAGRAGGPGPPGEAAGRLAPEPAPAAAPAGTVAQPAPVGDVRE
jgi:branched-chain amino acid transport system permease protein